MIYDVLDNAEQYIGLSENLDKALEYLMTTSIEDLPLGRTDIDGDDVYLTVSQITARSSEEALFETHNEYIDIHIDLEGVELFETALGELTQTAAYDPKNDIAFYKADLSCACVLGPGRFLLTMPGEAHKPAIASAQGTSVKKIIFKIKKEQA